MVYLGHVFAAKVFYFGVEDQALTGRKLGFFEAFNSAEALHLAAKGEIADFQGGCFAERQNGFGKAPFGFGRMKLSVTVSMGLAIAAADDTAASIFHRADEALYASKHAGRNCAHYHNGRSCEPILLGGSNDLDLITVEPNDGSAARAALPEELVTLCEELRNRLAEVSRNPSTLVRTAAED